MIYCNLCKILINFDNNNNCYHKCFLNYNLNEDVYIWIDEYKWVKGNIIYRSITVFDSDYSKIWMEKDNEYICLNNSNCKYYDINNCYKYPYIVSTKNDVYLVMDDSNSCISKSLPSYNGSDDYQSYRINYLFPELELSKLINSINL